MIPQKPSNPPQYQPSPSPQDNLPEKPKSNWALPFVIGVIVIALFVGAYFLFVKKSAENARQDAEEFAEELAKIDMGAMEFADTDTIIQQIEAQMPEETELIEPEIELEIELPEECFEEEIHLDEINKSSDTPKYDNNPNQVFHTAEQMPQFPGGEAALMKWLADHIMYPALAAENGVQGRVILQFVVKKDGSVDEVRVVRGKDPDLDREAVRVVRGLPKFIPGKMNGQAVNVWYTLPITFKLQGA